MVEGVGLFMDEIKNLEKEFAEGFKEIQDKYKEILKDKDMHYNEVLDYFIRIQKQYTETLNKAKDNGNAKKILYLTGLTDGINMIVGLLKSYVKG